MTEERDPAERRARLSELLGRVASHDQGALEGVYALTSGKLMGICLRILGDRAEAEDALQEVYISVWRRAASFDAARSSPITWLATLARNRAIDRLRSRKRMSDAQPIEAAHAVADGGPSALATLESKEDGQRLAGCLGELEERASAAIREAFFGGLSYPELAAAAGVPLGTVKSWIRRGMIKLKDCLER